MKRLTILLATIALLAAACSSGDDAKVASLDSGDDSESSAITQPADDQVDDSEAILAFSQCMRDEGIESFVDPEIGEDGAIEFRIRDLAGGGEDRETMRAAFEACSENLEGLSFGPGSIDRSEIEDNLYEFAVCMRENGYDMPDPDLSFTPGEGGGEDGQPRGPFGDDIDPEDPAFQTALAACQGVFGDTLRVPGTGGGPGGGDGGG